MRQIPGVRSAKRNRAEKMVQGLWAVLEPDAADWAPQLVDKSQSDYYQLRLRDQPSSKKKEVAGSFGRVAVQSSAEATASFVNNSDRSSD